MKYDFAGWATRNDIECGDHRVIRQDAFKDDDGKKVPLVWMHQHNSVDNVLGHAMLENRPEGVYAYGTFNDTEAGQNAKKMVMNGDVNALSIYANKLKQRGHDVLHGAIREVSLVLAGANPGAYIETVLAHSEDQDEEAIVYSGETLELAHVDMAMAKKPEVDQTPKPASKGDNMAISNTNAAKPAANSADDKTIQDVIDTMTEEQKNVLYALVGMAAEGQGDTDEEDEDMKHNLFEGDTEDDSFAHGVDFSEIVRDAKRYGSMKEAFIQHDLEDMTIDDVLQHDGTYGITPISDLFPDYKNVTSTPGFVTDDMNWVPKVMGSVSHTPFARIKTIFADITADDARAKGYLKGNQKKEEVFTLLKRTTDPQTVYKKQKLDRDDVVDITDFDVIAWLKGEMRMKLDEELARAFLVGDGRDASSDDKINPLHIRPIWTDEDFYTIKADIELDANATEDDTAKAVIRAAIKARKDYKGSGNPSFYCTEDMLTTMLLLTDNEGRDLYESVEKLAQKLRVKEIVTVPAMEGLTRSTTGDNAKTYTLKGIVVNLADYNVGADKGGAVNLFDDFDIDYNAQKYLIETRCSGALIKPYSAIAVETFPKA